MDPNNVRKYLFISFIFILLLCVTQAVGGEKILHSKIQSIEPEKTDGQYCFVKVLIKQNGDEIYKEEVLECADGKVGIETPGYWELFAEFYYRDVNVPEYCRYISRPRHAFFTYGKACLLVNGEWRIAE